MWSQVEEVKSDGGTTDEEGLTVSGRRKYHIYIISGLKEYIMCEEAQWLSSRVLD